MVSPIISSKYQSLGNYTRDINVAHVMKFNISA